MQALTERLDDRDFIAWVAMDTIDPLIERVVGIVGTDREMTLLHTYRHTVPHNPTDAQRDGKPLSRITIQTGLRLLNSQDYDVPAIDIWEQVNPQGKGLVVRLGTSILDGFGFSAHHHQGATEDEVRNQYHRHVAGEMYSRRRNLTKIDIVGVSGRPHRDDRIIIEHWNDHGVCSDKIVAFNG